MGVYLIIPTTEVLHIKPRERRSINSFGPCTLPCGNIFTHAGGTYSQLVLVTATFRAMTMPLDVPTVSR